MAIDTLQIEQQMRAKNYKTDPILVDLRAGIDGALVTQDWIDAMIARGYGWNISIGTATTPLAGGGAGTVFDPDQPMLVIDVPTGQTLVVYRADIWLETPLIAADDNEVESVLFVDQGALSGAAAANGTVEAPWNSRLDAVATAAGAGVTIVSAVTTNLTAAPTEDVALSHMSQVADVQTAVGVLWGNYNHLYEPKNPMLIVGQSTFVIDWAGTVAVSGYASVAFLVFPTSKISDLV